MGFVKFDNKEILKSLEDLKRQIDELGDANDEARTKLLELYQRISKIAKLQGASIPDLPDDVDDPQELIDFDAWLKENVPFEFNAKDTRFDITKSDVLVSTLIGGIAVILDFLIVKIPKNTSYHGKIQEGSPLTGFLRSFGLDENGKASSWVKHLEKHFKVPYDKSIDPSIPGFNPQYHRLQSLAHDPLLGIFFAILDINGGTMTTITKNGEFIIKKVAAGTSSPEFLEPIFYWFGHIISDVTTKMGIPIPGWCWLQTFKFGDFGEKHRTVAELSRYMYDTGYDMRHLATMSIVPLTIELLCRIYFCFMSKAAAKNASLSEVEYTELKNTIKLHRLLEICYSLAACGNVGKILAYQGNPNAFNLPLWTGCIKEAITAYRIHTRNTRAYEEAIEGRYTLDNNWDLLLEASRKMYEEVKNNATDVPGESGMESC